jgi:hypothetical protein
MLVIQELTLEWILLIQILEFLILLYLYYRIEKLEKSHDLND